MTAGVSGSGTRGRMSKPCKAPAPHSGLTGPQSPGRRLLQTQLRATEPKRAPERGPQVRRLRRNRARGGGARAFLVVPPSPEVLTRGPGTGAVRLAGPVVQAPLDVGPRAGDQGGQQP